MPCGAIAAGQADGDLGRGALSSFFAVPSGKVLASVIVALLVLGVDHSNEFYARIVWSDVQNPPTGCLAWGEAQMADYVANHYHQPSDEYRADWDFRGNAKLARFGFVLGWLASEQQKSIEWLPGDEFEAARKASEKTGSSQ